MANNEEAITPAKINRLKVVFDLIGSASFAYLITETVKLTVVTSVPVSGTGPGQRSNYTAGAGFASKLQSQRFQPRSGAIFVEQRRALESELRRSGTLCRP